MTTLESTYFPDYKLLLLLAVPILVAMAALTLYPSDVLRWIQRKRYQYEITFSLYMLTPTEKFIFNSILFLFLAMVSIAASLYLPGHITIMIRRAYWYLLGDADALSAASKSSLGVADLAQAVGESMEAATSTISAAGSLASSTVGHVAADEL